MVDTNVRFYSNTLVRDVSVRVYIPRGFSPLTDKIIYLFHGYMGNKDDWTNLGNAYNFSENNKIALIMPSLENSWSINVKGGYNYFDFLAYECLDTVLDTFSWPKDNLYIAGLSMGGYSALHIGLTRDIFKGIGTFSGVTDIISKFSQKFPDCMINYANSVSKTDSIEYLLTSRENKYSKLYQYCGTSDHLVAMNMKYKEIFADNVIDFKFSTDNRGHEWSAWTDCLAEFIDFIK